jgi:hypothetical protein
MADPKACHVPFPADVTDGLTFPAPAPPLPYLPPLLPRIDHHVYARAGFVIAMNGEEITRRLRLQADEIQSLLLAEKGPARVRSAGGKPLRPTARLAAAMDTLQTRLKNIDFITSHLVRGEVYELSLNDLILLGLYTAP